MAALAPNQVRQIWSSLAGGYQACVYEVRGCSTGDTYDFSGQWRNLQHVYLSPTTKGVGDAKLAFTNTTVTFDKTGMTVEAGYLWITGVPI